MTWLIDLLNTPVSIFRWFRDRWKDAQNIGLLKCKKQKQALKTELEKQKQVTEDRLEEEKQKHETTEKDLRETVDAVTRQRLKDCEKELRYRKGL